LHLSKVIRLETGEDRQVFDLPKVILPETGEDRQVFDLPKVILPETGESRRNLMISSPPQGSDEPLGDVKKILIIPDPHPYDSLIRC
jgi:hypothetical protein